MPTPVTIGLWLLAIGTVFNIWAAFNSSPAGMVMLWRTPENRPFIVAGVVGGVAVVLAVVYGTYLVTRGE